MVEFYNMLSLWRSFRDALWLIRIQSARWDWWLLNQRLQMFIQRSIERATTSDIAYMVAVIFSKHLDLNKNTYSRTSS